MNLGVMPLLILAGAITVWYALGAGREPRYADSSG
jgi:hypothetical protein